jgi:hypothetical protein
MLLNGVSYNGTSYEELMVGAAAGLHAASSSLHRS